MLTDEFVQAVLSNNLKESFALADEINRRHLFEIVSWLYMHAPSVCWGSAEKVDSWVPFVGPEQREVEGYGQRWLPVGPRGQIVFSDMLNIDQTGYESKQACIEACRELVVDPKVWDGLIKSVMSGG